MDGIPLSILLSLCEKIMTICFRVTSLFSNFVLLIMNLYNKLKNSYYVQTS